MVNYHLFTVIINHTPPERNYIPFFFILSLWAIKVCHCPAIIQLEFNVRLLETAYSCLLAGGPGLCDWIRTYTLRRCGSWSEGWVRASSGQRKAPALPLFSPVPPCPFLLSYLSVQCNLTQGAAPALPSIPRGHIRNTPSRFWSSQMSHVLWRENDPADELLRGWQKASRPPRRTERDPAAAAAAAASRQPPLHLLTFTY